MKRKTMTLVLALCLMVVSAIPAETVPAAISAQDSYYLSVLRPQTPKTSESYPARLHVSASMRTTSGMVGHFTLPGKLAMDATISDEELLAMLKNGLSAVPGYDQLEKPVDDKKLVQELTEKLRFSDQDLKDILDNLKKIAGIDTIVDLLSGKMPEMSDSDVVNTILDGLQGEIPMMPGMPGFGTIVDGAFIVYEEFGKDQQKYRDIIALSQAKQRLRGYYARVDRLVRDFISEKGDWSLRFNEEDVVEGLFQANVDSNRMILTPDVHLTKDDGSAGNITGTYTGHFKLRWDVDLRSFDANYGAACRTQLHKSDLPGVPAQTDWQLTTDEGSPSEHYIVQEAAEYQVSLSLPAGVNRAFIEMPLPTDSLPVTNFVQNIQRTVILTFSNMEMSGHYDMSINADSSIYVQTLFLQIETEYHGITTNDNTEITPMNITSIPNLQITLVIDMLD